MRSQFAGDINAAADRAAGFAGVHRRARRTCLAAWLLLGAVAGPAWAQLSSEDIAALRERGRAEGWTFTVAESEATRYPLEQLCGLVALPDRQESGALTGPAPATRQEPAAFDWRTAYSFSACTDVKSQGGCGACWAFAAIGVVESTLLIHEGVNTDLSEQWLISCTGAGDCDGGDFRSGLGYLRCSTTAQDPCGDSGAVLETDFPYVAWNALCDCPYPHPYCIYSRAYVNGDWPSVSDLKQAILSNGPVAVGIYANAAFHAYSSGVFNDCEDEATNHGVVLVGWDDNQGTGGVWILRNSWGPSWGEGGYALIEYGCSRVGYRAHKVNYDGGDCNGNGVQDSVDIAGVTSEDCNANEVPDECDLTGITSLDCNTNDVPDECDVAGPTSEDCNGNVVPDECEPQEDCNSNGVQDICDIAGPTSEDCNENIVPDECDLAEGTSLDGNGNDTPDECEDCNGNEVFDVLESSIVLFSNTSPMTDPLDTTAPVAQDIDLPGPAWLRQFTVYYRSIGSSPGTMMVRFYDGGPGGSTVPAYPDGLIDEYSAGQLVWDPDNFNYKMVDLDPPLWLPSHLWMEVEIDQDAGVVLRSGSATVGHTDGWIYDRNAGDMLPGCPLYMSLGVLGIQCLATGCICGDINESGGPVDLSDFGLFALCYGSSEPAGDCTAEYFECSDLDGSGVVDLSDFGLFALWYGQEGAQTTPDCVPE